MSVGPIGDGLEILGYFTGFWLFLFSRDFRKAWLADFRREAWYAKCFSVFEAMLSVFFGLVLPVGLIGAAVAWAV